MRGVVGALKAAEKRGRSMTVRLVWSVELAMKGNASECE